MPEIRCDQLTTSIVELIAETLQWQEFASAAQLIPRGPGFVTIKREQLFALIEQPLSLSEGFIV